MPRHPEGQSFGQEMNQETVGEFTPSRWPLVRIMREMTGGEIPEGENKAEDNKDGGKEKEKAVTIFERFVSSLKNQLEKEKTATIGGTAMTWKEFPLEEALADGLWVIMLKAAELGKEKIATDEVVAKSAKLVNYFIETGILLQYKTPDEAANAFLDTVPKALEEAMAEKEPGVIFVAADVLRGPVAQFFASAIRTVRETGQEMKTLLTDIEKENLAEKKHGVEYVSDLSNLEIISRPEKFDIAKAWGQNYSSGINDPASQTARLVTEARETPDRIAMVKQFMPDVGSIPNDVLTKDTSIDSEWIKTQLCLAAVHAPKRDYLTHEELEAAFPAIKKIEETELINLFYERMRERNANIVITPELDELIRKRISVLRSVEGGVQKDSSFAVYVQLDLDRFYKAMDHESALDFVKKLSIDEKKIKMTAEIQKRSGTVIEDIVKAIDWKKVYTYDINEIIRAGVLPPVMIAQGILQMEPEEKISTIKFLSTYSDVDFELYNKIIEELRKLGEKIDSTADEKIKKDFSFLTTPEIIDKIVELTHETELNSDDVRELMARLDPNDIIALFERPDIRKDIVFSFDGVMVTKVENKKEDKKIQDKQKTIKKKLGSDRTIRWMLANEVSTRAELDYPNPKPSKEELREMPRWEKIYSKKEIAEAQKRLGIRQSDIKKFVDEHSEEEILRWIYEADADVENSIKKFITNRENFYKVSK